MHPKELLEDVRGPKGEGSLEARMEELEQEVFRYKKMEDHEVEIYYIIKTTNNQRLRFDQE
jgi:hypothetical protein